MDKKQNIKPTSSFSLFTKSKDIILSNFNTFGLLLLLPFLDGLYTTIKSSRLNTVRLNGTTASVFDVYHVQNFTFALIFLILAIVYLFTTIMLCALSVESSKGKKLNLTELWPYVKKFGVRFIGASLLIGLIVVCGFIAFIVPGLIFLRRYYLTPYIIIDKDLSINNAMKESARLSKPYSGYVWGVLGVTILLSLPAVIPVFGWLISFVLTSLYTVAPALRYQELKKLVA